MKIVVFSLPQEGCVILYPNYNAREKKLEAEAVFNEDGSMKTDAVYRTETDDEVLQRVIDRDIPSNAQHITTCTEADLPYSGWTPERKTRTVAMRNSWINPPDTTSPPVVDMNKARNGKLEEYKAKRLPVLEDLDLAVMKADESGDTAKKASIVLEKQKLRDLPSDCLAAMEAITDAEVLDNYDPVLDIVINMPVF
ncbi:MAG: hypothetical protein OEX12_14480 [Gammaproteobacteria bacterium]|nr:hypothetical protein [Gammaproteobacteria bacterium]